MTVAASATAERKTFWLPIIAGCNPAPVLQPTEHNPDPVMPFVASLVLLSGFAARLPALDAGLYPLVFQRIFEPVSVTAAVGQQPFWLWQAA